MDGFEVEGDGLTIEEIIGHQIDNAMSITAAALVETPSRRQALSLWSALRSLIEAKFPLKLVMGDE